MINLLVKSFIEQKYQNKLWLQLLRYEDVQLFCVFCDHKEMTVFWTAGWRKQDICRCPLGLWQRLTGILSLPSNLKTTWQIDRRWELSSVETLVNSLEIACRAYIVFPEFHLSLDLHIQLTFSYIPASIYDTGKFIIHSREGKYKK